MRLFTMKPGIKEQEKGLNSKESYFLRQVIQGQSKNSPQKESFLEN